MAEQMKSDLDKKTNEALVVCWLVLFGSFMNEKLENEKK
jgi:hypothetical protein